jgi:transposase-like protein
MCLVMSTPRSRPMIVKKRQRRLTGVDQIVLSLSARGLTTGEISAHFAEVYGASVSELCCRSMPGGVVVVVDGSPAAKF